MKRRTASGPMSLVSVLAVATLLVGSACSSAKRVTHGGLVPGQSVDNQAKICLMNVPDGVERNDGPAAGSGNAIKSGLRDNLIEHKYRVVPIDTVDLATGFEQSLKLDCGLLLRASLTEWEDNATAWSGRPDSAGLEVELFRTDTKELVGSATHTIKASTVAWTSKRPDRFVSELTENTLGPIFGWTPASL